MKADAALFENYAVAHRLGIGVMQPLTCIDEMPVQEYNRWCAFLELTSNSSSPQTEDRSPAIDGQTQAQQMAILTATGGGQQTGLS